MIFEIIVGCIMAGIILVILIALVLCIGAAIYASRESPEKEPWNRHHPEESEEDE